MSTIKIFDIIGEEDHYRKAYAHFIHQDTKQAAPFIGGISLLESIALVRRAIIKTLNS